MRVPWLAAAHPDTATEAVATAAISFSVRLTCPCPLADAPEPDTAKRLFIWAARLRVEFWQVFLAEAWVEFFRDF